MTEPAQGFTDLFRDLDPAERELLIASLSAEEADSAEHDWASWAHDGQLAPAKCTDGSDWSTWVIKGGRGFGKTLAGAQWVAALAQQRTVEPLRIALAAATIDEARRVMIEGESGLIAVAGGEIERWHPSRRLLRFRSGAEAVLFSGASPEALRGPQHHFAWCDELAKWEKPRETWDMLQLGLRLGERPRALITTTPRAGPVLRAIMADPDTVTTGGATARNPHLPPVFKRRVEALYAGTRLGRQELDGELLVDAGALWTVELIEKCRFPSRLREGLGVGLSVSDALASTAPPPAPPASGRGVYARTLIAVDPPSGDGTCGIIACARDAAGVGHVLADHSVTGRSPEGWARAVAGAAEAHGTTEVIAEANQGGKMVKAVLMTADPGLRVKLVTASKGKSLRAEPVAHLFEAGKVWLHGRMPELEAELLGMIAGGGYEGPGTSPDRADAMVWGVGELMLGRRGEGRVTGM